MAELNIKVCLSLLIILQAYPAEVFGWSRTQAWSFKGEEECLSYYANMIIEEGSWCSTMWDGLLCWPPSPYDSVALLPCPPNHGSHERARTAYKRCSLDGKWEDAEDPSSSSSHSSSDPQSGPSHQMSHPCITPPGGGTEDIPTSSGVVTAYRVTSKIEQRYAQTTVIATIVNTDTQPSQLQFKLTLPKTAFISSLVMEIDGANFTSTVKKKSVASRSYQVAKEKAKDAALVEQSGIQEFEVSANIVSRQVTFYIKYEELLRRINGQYVQKIYVRPGTRIPEAEVDVHIHEPEPIKDYRILELPGQELHGNPGAHVSEPLVNDNEIKVRYKHLDPPNGSGRGVDGTFTIAYSLQNQVDGGKIQRVGSYFNHFLSLDASERLPKMPTHTVFGLDVSNSMGGGKLTQMKAALKDIIKSMSANDSFEILAFSSDVASLGVFNGTHYRRALRRVKKLQPMSYSDLNTAYLQALKSADAYTRGSPTAKQIVMITDGQPTHGILDPSAIRRNVLEANGNRYPIFGIGFGLDAQFNLLQQISSDSEAFARHLNVKKDLAKELKEFYREISNPILTNLVITYPENEVDPASVVKIANSYFYSGGEVVAVGRAFPGVRNIHPWVTGVGQIGPMQLQMNRLDSMVDTTSSEDQMDDSVVVRLWAYLTVQHLLKQAEMNDNYPQVKRLLDQATQLALKFRFVTLVTSLVVRDATGEYEADVFEGDLPLPHPSSTASSSSSSTHGPSELQQADAPRPPRRHMSQPRPQSYDREPHFVVHSPGMSLPLCFDYHAHDGAYVNLIRDSASGIIVNGETRTAVGRPKKTYITKLFLSFSKVNITLTPENMEVDCVDDDGNLEVDRVTKSLWPFYKGNGKKYKKMMLSHDSKGTPHRPVVSLGQEDRQPGRVTTLQSSGVGHHRTHEYKSHPRAGYRDPQQMSHLPLKSYPGGGLLTDDGKDDEVRYVMNSVADDYIPHRNVRRFAGHRSRQRTQSGRRLSRQSARVKKGEKKITQSDHSLCSFNSTWEHGVGKKYGDVMVILKNKNMMHIMVGDGEAHYVIVRSQKNGQRFLGFYLEDEKAMSSEAHGLIGQFTSKVITISSPPPSSSPPKDNLTSIELLVKRRNRRKRYRMSHVSGFLSKHRSVLRQEQVECIEVGRQGKGLIDGKPNDYLVSCLQC